MKKYKSPQVAYQSRHARKRLCRLCSEKRVAGRKLCKKHLVADAERSLRRYYAEKAYLESLNRSIP